MEKKKFVISNTLGMFDLLKGIMILLMMVSHTYGLASFADEYQTLDELLEHVDLIVLIIFFVVKVIAEASMPAFFVISGYGFRKTNNVKKALAKHKSLAIYYVVTMAVTVVLHFFCFWFLYGWMKASVSQTLSVFLGGLFGLPMDRSVHGFWLRCCGPMWFILALLVSNVIYTLLAYVFEDKKLLLISLLVACVGWLFSFAGPLPWCLSQGLIAVFFVGLGNYIKKHKILINGIKSRLWKAVIIICMIIYLVFVSTSGTFDMANDQYPLGPVSIVANGFFGIVLIRFFLRLNKFSGAFSNSIRTIGRYSLYVLCIHSVEMNAVGGYVQYLFVNDWWKGGEFMRSLIIIVVRITLVLTATTIFIHFKEKKKS